MTDAEPPDYLQKRIDDQAADWFTRLRSEQVTATERLRFAQWLSQNPAHAQAFAEVETLWSALDAPSRDVWTSHHATYPVSAAGQWLNVRRAHLRWQRLTASCLALLLAWNATGFSSYLRYWRSDYRTDYGEQRTLQLEDGSTLTLNTRTAVSVRFTEKRREIQLAQGQIFLDVRHDPSRPFVVSSDYAEIRDIGTRFEVYRRDAAVEVTVTDGEVSVAATNHAPLRVHAGWQSTVDTNGLKRMRAVDTPASTAWRHGKLVFQLQSLGSVVAELNRYRAGTIVLFDAQLRARLVSGTINLNDANASLTALANTLHLRTLQLPGAVTWLY